ncbi:hypothetical protein Scep_028297 [Stephania cephalantha]|uniref:AT-hook motif nuclear-localized protein n=1 Tax=Stephania cephalantha TaxID=152367 RepID=A0AAP0E9N2_9MAGN
MASFQACKFEVNYSIRYCRIYSSRSTYIMINISNTNSGGGQCNRTGGLSVSLAGPNGRVLGGGVAGLLTTKSLVQLSVRTAYLLSGHVTATPLFTARKSSTFSRL